MHFVVGRAVEDQTRPDTETELEILDTDDFPFPALRRAMRERHAVGASVEDDFGYSLRIMLLGLRAIHERRFAAPGR